MLMKSDDSGSMGTPLEDGSRASDQVELVKRMARLCTKIVPDDTGVDLFYIHSNGVLEAREDELVETMKQTYTNKNTPIGTRLQQKILEPFVYQVLEGADKTFQRPLLIVIITDGGPNGEENDDDKTFEKAILDCIDQLKKHGYPEHGELILPKISDCVLRR
jgi:hypothetical protein